MVGAEARTYDRQQCVSFRKTDGTFGGLSNMAPGFPLKVNGVLIRTSEALYQACRFPHLPKVQRLIIDEGSPMTAKMKSKPYRSQSRPDWDAVRVKIMRWCLRVKLAQHWETFSRLLLATGDQPIVEDSRKDDFWGAKPQDDGTLVGGNVLGRLLMELREQLRHSGNSALSRVEPLTIPHFLLYERPIEPIDVRFGADLSDSPRDLISASTAPHLAPPPASAPVSDPRGSPTSHVPITETKHVDSKPNLAAYPKRLIEVDLPIRRISVHARREKSMRAGTISPLHIWWARRPLAACRAVTCAALWADPNDVLTSDRYLLAVSEAVVSFAKSAVSSRTTAGLLSGSWQRWQRLALAEQAPLKRLEAREALLDFIAAFANPDAASDAVFGTTAQRLTAASHAELKATPNPKPFAFDPFAGGGAMPVECLRVGCEVLATDLNPVAVSLNRALVEYAPRFRSELRHVVLAAARVVRDKAYAKLGAFYPNDANGARPIAYLWARTIRCEGPGCGLEVPLVRSASLAKRGTRSVFLRLTSTGAGIAATVSDATASEPVARATVARGSATCPACGYTTKVTRVREQLSERRGGSADARLLGVVLARPGERGRFYRSVTDNDIAAFEAARRELDKFLTDSPDLLPRETISTNELRRISVPLYGMRTWADLYNPRQALTLTTLAQLISTDIVLPDEDLCKAARLYLSLALDRMAENLTTLCRWNSSGEKMQGTFGRQAIAFVSDFCEASPFSDSVGDWLSVVDNILTAHDTASALPASGTVGCADARHVPLPDDAADALLTDPPYYDAVPYAHLADFFYSWERRTLRADWPDLFDSDSIDKTAEIVVDRPHRKSTSKKGIREYEAGLKAAFEDARRVVAPGGIGVIVFASKTTASWEAVLQALLNAGWVVTGSWPIDSEMGTRMNAMGTASLASSVHIVCRPRERQDGSLSADLIGDWRDVLRVLPVRIREWLPRLASEGVVGADAIFACLGPALEIFSRYARVEKISGEEVKLREYLEHVWAAVSREALTMIFDGAETEGLESDARLTAMWLWTLAATGSERADEATESEDDDVPDDEDDDKAGGSAASTNAGYVLEFDAARKIAQGLGARFEELQQVVEINADKARLISVGERMKYLFGQAEPVLTAKKAAKKKQIALFAELDQAAQVQGWGEVGAPKVGTTTLDRVHQAMLLFGSGRGEALKRFIVEEGVGKQPQFWKLAQALSALYPSSTDEKRWVDGVLARKKGLGF